MRDKLIIYYFSSTHWDREWYQSFQGFRHRLVEMMNDLIETMEKNSDYKVFHTDGQTILLEDYLQIEPGKKDRLKKLIDAGRIVIGPWYVMPDEFLLSGESLIRNLMVGYKICSEWGVKPWKCGYICDIFGHIAQMPQIFNGFGINSSLLGRGTNEHSCPAHFKWQSPDGSSVTTFKVPDSHGYGDFFIKVSDKDRPENPLSETELSGLIKEYIDSELKRSPIPVVVLMDGADHQWLHKDIPRNIEIIKKLYPDADVRYTNLEDMVKEVEAYTEVMPTKEGEINETAKIDGSYIHLITHTLSSRYPIKKANDECQTLLEKWIEPLAALYELKNFCIQKSYIDLAYKYLLKNHPHDSICGCSIDRVHNDMEYRFSQTKEICNQLIDVLFDYERKQNEVDKSSDVKVLSVWNPLPFARREVITVDIDFPKDYPTKFQEPFGYELKNSFRIIDSSGKEIPYNLASMKKNYIIRSVNQYREEKDVHTISFEACLPSMGIAEYKIVPCDVPTRYLDKLSKSERTVENEYLKLYVNDNGTIKIYDKSSGKTYDNLISYKDNGEIGDGWYHVAPVEDRIISSFGMPCTIEKIEDGVSRVVFQITHDILIPASRCDTRHTIKRSNDMKSMKIRSKIGLSKGNRFVDVETIIDNNSKDHRLKLIIPTHIEEPTYFANQSFYFVERSCGIDIATGDWKEPEALEKQMGGIVGKRAADGAGLAFVSAYGLHECACLSDDDASMQITLFRGFEKTFMKNGEPGGQILGTLQFKYLIAPIQQNTSYADLTRMQDCLSTGVKTFSYAANDDYSLKPNKSNFELISDNVCLSILKRPEDDDKGEVMIRLCNMSNKISDFQMKSAWEIKSVYRVNLNEEHTSEVTSDCWAFSDSLNPWQIQTYILKISKE